jgi:dsDNA-specific endonuclease/ATPase MutS2
MNKKDSGLTGFDKLGITTDITTNALIIKIFNLLRNNNLTIDEGLTILNIIEIELYKQMKFSSRYNRYKDKPILPFGDKYE